MQRYIETIELCKRAPLGLSISEAIKWLRKRWYLTGTKAQFINSGDCEEFAWCILSLLGFEKETSDIEILGDGINGPGHYWIYYYGKHYDAECSNGVKEPKDLPLFQLAEYDPYKDEDLHWFS